METFTTTTSSRPAITGWLSIRSQSLVSPEFDVAAFLWNPLGTVPTPERTASRLRALESAGLDRYDLRSWAIVRSVLWDLPVKPGEEMTSRALAVVKQILDS